MVQNAVAGPGRSLEPEVRGHFETELGAGLGGVRVHTDAEASASARALGAKAYTVGSDVVFSPGSYQAGSPEGRGLLAHELAHVVQQSTSGTPVLAASPDIGFWDVVDVVSPVAGEIGRASGLEGEDVLEGAGRAVLGDTLWDILHAFAHGFMEGLRNAPKDQLKRISDKFSDFGLSDWGEFGAGYALGVPKGVWYELRDLFEAIKTLLGLPEAISRFLTQTLPQLAVRLGQLIEQPGGLRDQLKRVNEAFAKDPRGFMAQVDRLLDAARAAILAEIEKRGQGAASRALSFLDEPWYDIGGDVGELTGRVLFEVLLAVGTEAIGNFIAGALELAGKVVGTVVEAALDVVRGLGKLFGTMLEWLEGLVARVAGQAGELFDALRGLVAGLRRVAGELGAAEVEAAGAGGAGVRLPAAEAGRGGAMEARALKRPPGSPTVDDLYGRTPKTAEPKPGAPKPPKTPPKSETVEEFRKRPPSRRPGRTLHLTSSGIKYQLTIDAEAEAAFRAIPTGRTVVYTILDSDGEVIYVGISEKTAERSAVVRLSEHLYTKEGEFVGEASELRLVGDYEELEAHALEQELITEHTPGYNKDKTPWDTYVKGHPRVKKPRRLGDFLPDWRPNVPKQNRFIRFFISFE